MTPLTAKAALDAYFLEARCKLLDVAAILDRVDRGEGASAVQSDPRLVNIRRAVELLLDRNDDHAEQVQEIFSLPYDAGWKRPDPK